MPRKTDISDYPDKWLDCRALGHAWKRNGVYKIKGRTGTVRVLKCWRCPVKRRDHIDALGQCDSRNYSYPPGYKLGKVSRREFTRETLRRIEVQVVLSVQDLDI